MRIDFSMTGLNICLLIGIVMLLFSTCMLLMQRPIKNRKKLTVRDYFILGFILLFAVAGIVLTTLGFIDAFSVMTV